MRRVFTWRGLGAAVAIATAVPAGAVLWLTGELGLAARASGPSQSSTVGGPDRLPDGDAIDRWTDRVESADVRVVWDGLLGVPGDRRRQLAVASAGGVRIRLDGRVLIDAPPEPFVTVTTGADRLTPGPHLLSIDYARASGPPDFALLWVEADGSRRAVAATALSPRTIRPLQWRARQAAPVAVRVLLVLWIALLGVAGWLALRRWVIGADLAWSRAEIGATSLCGCLFVAGIWWGWPGPGWAPDEFDPAAVLDAWARGFSGGWHDKYPPGYYYLLAVAYAPVLVADAFARVNLGADAIEALLYLVNRTVSLGAALGTVLVVAALANRTLGARYGWLAGLWAGLFLPSVFYAKTSNIESTYVFWCACALVLFHRALTTRHRRDLVALGLMLALAIATKDQAYGVFVLPVLYLGKRLWPDRRADLIAAGAAAALAFALLHNLPLNWSGFVGHLEALVGPASAGYRAFDAGPSGQARLLLISAGLLAFIVGLPGVIAMGIGALSQVQGRSPRIPLWLWLAPLSYWLTFLVVVGYVYDRFLLPVLPPFALLAAVGTRALLDRQVPRLPGAVATATAVVLLALLGWRAVLLDVRMIFDSRYVVEHWLHAEVPPDAHVASYGPPTYLPRRGRHDWRELRPSIAETLERRPDFIVVNTEYAKRDLADPTRRAWLDWLFDGSGPYREAFRTKTNLDAVLLWPDARFRDTEEDPFTNLDKINPEIAVFRWVPERP